MTTMLLLAMSLSFLFSPAWSCMGGSGPNTTPTPDGGSTPPTNNDCFGTDFTPGEWNPKQFNNEGGGPVLSKEETSCDFEGDCCYANDDAPNDQLEWSLGDNVNSDKFQKCFGSSAPNGKFLYLSTPAGAGSSDEGIFYSCTIACTTGPITVTLKHWQTAGVNLQVCTRDAFQSSGPLSNCQTVPSTSPGPDTITLPQTQFFEIVFVASNMGTGSAVAIDDVVTNYNICPPDTTTAAPVTTPAPGVSTTPGPGGSTTPSPCNLACNFEKGNPCSYVPLTSTAGGGNSRWAVKQGPFGNPDNGVPHAAAGSEQGGTKYLGVRLAKKKDKAVLVSGPLKLKKAATLRFLAYEATKSCVLKVCVNTQSNCPYSSNPDVQVDDRQWKQGEVPIDASTKKVFIIAENKDNNICYVGFDNFQVVGGGTNC